jgi:AhpD family alkylhydroperoxidase
VAFRALVALLAIASTSPALAAPAPQAFVPVKTLLAEAKARVGGAARVPLGAVEASALTDAQRLYGPDVPSFARVLAGRPELVAPFADVPAAFLFKGTLPTEVKAALGLRIAQANRSPYVAAHMHRLLGATPKGAALRDALAAGSLAALAPDARAAIEYGESLTRDIHGVSPEQFGRTRAHFNDAQIVELTFATCWMNYWTRFAEGLRLPVEPWALAPAQLPAPEAPEIDVYRSAARVALISDDEIAATTAAAAAAKSPESPTRSLGLGLANSQRAMLRVPALAMAWRTWGVTNREKATVGRDILLQVSFAVSMVNGCRYCTLHQVLGLRRLGVEPAKLVAMKKDDSALAPRELAAVTFARALTERPGGVTDADYAALVRALGDQGALEVLMQTCNFAFMNRFTDGLALPSEDEAVKVYKDVYGTAGGSY